MPQYQGVWTLPVAARLQSNQQWVTDPVFDYTTLLLQADNAPNGAQNNTFIDSSSNNFTITRNGNTTQGTFTPYSLQPGAWSNFFNGSSYLTIPDNAAFDIGASEFSIEAFVYPAASVNTTYIFGQVQASTANGSYVLWVDSSGYLTFYSTTGGTASTRNDITSSTVLPLNIWSHVCICRSGTTLSLYLNGVRVATQTYSATIFNATNTVAIGADAVGAVPFNGYISGLRYLKGSSAYDATQTRLVVPTTSLTAITNTQLLTCQSNRFVDNSTNAFAITVNGNTSVQAFSPFAPQYQWTAPVIGGSGYFDGNGDYLTLPVGAIPSGAGTEFTIEFWINQPSLGGTVLRANGNGSSLSISISGSGQIGLDNVFVASILTTTGTITANAWNHVAITRTTANLYTVYINGVSAGSATYTGSLGSQQQFIGYNTFSGAFLTAYISGFRCVNSVVYASAFAPPTIPPTAIANTGLLLNFTNAGIVDGTMKNNLETVGNAQVNTSIVKYGTGSMAFDGSGDYCLMQNTPNLRLASTEAFTVEFWVYANALSSDQHVIHAYGLVSPFPGWAFGFGSGGVANTTLAFYDGTTWRNVGTGFVTGNWYHIAVTSQGASSTGRFFVNGAQQGSSVTFASTITNSVAPIAIGSQSNGSFSFNGYIDDLRITKGIARYTANFTPPTVALPRQ